VGGEFMTAAVFASDALSLGDRLTINAGVRFDHSRAISQDLNAVDQQGAPTGATIHGLGTLYTWNVVSPRLGVTAKLTTDGRTMLRASYGRFNQGVLTGEISPIHPGAAPVTTTAFDAGTGDIRASNSLRRSATRDGERQGEHRPLSAAADVIARCVGATIRERPLIP
jgi:outer membrane receptor protein involved in Fe transport